MIKLMVLYKKPDDLDAFMTHYRETHTPLVLKTPGLAKLVVDRVTADAFGGEPDYVLIAEMHFPDHDTFRAAMKSEENRAVSRDLTGFAKGLATVLITDSDEVVSRE